jgi:hypothetical protein
MTPEMYKRAGDLFDEIRKLPDDRQPPMPRVPATPNCARR